MKLKNIRFLSEANIKGNKKSSYTVLFVCLLVVSLTLILSFSVVINNSVNEYKNDVRARMIELSPCENGEITEELKARIMSLEHIESVNTLKGMRNQYINIVDISEYDKDCRDIFNDNKLSDSFASIWSLIGDEKMSVIAGESLDETPVFSCIIPSLFYPFEYETTDENLNYIDGESLIGKTITIKPSGNNGFETLYNIDPSVSPYTNEWMYLPALEYKLKVVGVYYASPTAKGYYEHIYVSEETGRLILEKAITASSIDNKESEFMKWWNTPSLRTHYIVIDDYDNLTEVCNNLFEIGINVSPTPELGIRNGVMMISKIFSVASTLFIIVSLILCIVNLVQSTILSLLNRKAEIGLLKAMGYKTSNIFSCMYYEQLSLTLKGCFIGALISSVVILITNYIFNHSTYVNRLYVVDWKYYFTFLMVSVTIAIVVPLICQVCSLHKLLKIHPKEAMS